MSTYVLVPGAGGEAWYWSRVVGELTRRGHEAIAVDLLAADESAGLAEYVDVVVAAAEGQDEARRRNDEQEGRSPDGEFDPFTYFLPTFPPTSSRRPGTTTVTSPAVRSSSSAVCRRSGWA